MKLPSGKHVAPSILAADHGRLRAQVAEIVEAGAQVIHVDIMDGHFVPPLTFGPGIVAGLAELGVFLDVHLMVERPERHVADFAKAGADMITIHAEATPHLDYALAEIRAAGAAAGLAVCPGTPLDVFAELEGRFDMALCMTVNPGWGGQPFITTSPDKLQRMAPLIGDATLMVDGGVTVDTAPLCVRAGARWLVAGSAVFGGDDPGAAYQAITEAAAGA